MLEKINRLADRWAILIIVLIGIAVFFSGLNNAFAGDDDAQIVNALPVHSISHIKQFFEGGTFYVDGGVDEPMYGVYYRPLMTVTFSVIYSLFGPHPVYFHVVQLGLAIGASIFLYLFFRYSFKVGLALLLALVFLVHPIRSQTVFAIPAMQDALFFFFGILALWLLARFRTVRSLIFPVICLFLALLAKESAVLFVAISLLFMFVWDRKRFLPFVGILALPIVFWLTLKINAVGLIGANPHNTPIADASLATRLLTAPSVMLMYFTKFVLPVDLASQYHWVHSNLSFRYVILPLVTDLAVATMAVLGALRLKKVATKAEFYTYLFFGVWTILGLALIAQIIPLDMTACENWFYFPLAGLLGMIGVFINCGKLPDSLKRVPWFVVVCLIVVALGARTAIRGTDWRNIYTISRSDINASAGNFNSYNVLAAELYFKEQYSSALPLAKKSVDMYAQSINLNTLGLIEYKLGEFNSARLSFIRALKYGDSPSVYESAALAMLYSGEPQENIRFIQKALGKYPDNSTLWLWLAVIQYKNGNINNAKQSINNARAYGSNPTVEQAYSLIMSNQAITLSP